MAETEADENGHNVKAVTQGKLPSGHNKEIAPPTPELNSPAKEVSLAALTEPVPEKKVKEAAAVKHKVVILTVLVLMTVLIRPPFSPSSSINLALARTQEIMITLISLL
ncbi:hypothetical protein F5146DRAFT_1146627 [Armillaria mellea]|nr:hypothetical protein F5146DRAFT_1146627 [Armillaria mellea]